MRRLWFVACCGFVAVLRGFVLTLTHQEAFAWDVAHEEDARELAALDRFAVVLEKNPRRGTALDKFYAFHVERGSLESTIAAYRERARKSEAEQRAVVRGSPDPAQAPDRRSPLADVAKEGKDERRPPVQRFGGVGRPAPNEGASNDAASLWMIVGLLESLRGQEAGALEAFEKAERLDATNSLASYYLGQTLVLVGQSDNAVDAFERAIARKPARADLLEVFQALGRVHQRTARSDKALDVWNRLEQQFPDDERVQEQIATTLLDEEAFDAALPRFEKLAQATKDRSRQLAFRMEAADIKVRLGQTDAALKEFESLLGQLNPDHWVYRDVRRRIEAIYLRTEDRAGLATYYEAWLVKHPEDLDAIARVAKVYATLGRDSKSQEWLERGVKLAPSRKELRRALIDRLMESHRFAEAIAHFEQLNRDEPNNPDTLRDWGRALLKDPQRDDVARREAAASVWRKLAEAKPNDALVASQVGDLLRQAELTDEAIGEYRRAVALAPDATQYREYLGEYFHSLKRSDDALATWRPMAEGDRHTAANVGRLAEVLAGFGYVDEAITNYTEACRLDPKDFALQLKRIDLLARVERHEEVIEHLAAVAKLVANEEEHEAWLSRDLRTLQAVGKLKERIAKLEATGHEDKEAVGAGEKEKQELADRWYWLARAHEAERQMAAAAKAVHEASRLAPRSIPILRASARILEARRDLSGAIEVYTRLVTLDRRYRTEYLQQLATLERQLGRRDKALQAGRDLVAAAPDNPELADFFAQLCFQLNAVDEGLNALRRSARANSSDPMALVRLASALIERQRAGEAIDLLWRAFDKSQKLDDRLPIVQKLIEAHAVANQQSRVIERLQRLRRERSQRREMTLCLAQAYEATGNDTQAQKELESLLTEETRDPSLLTRLRQLAEKRQDWTTAADYQRQIWQFTNDKRDRFLLAGLLMKLGQVDEAVELLIGGEKSKELTAEVLKLLDGLYETGKNDVLLARLKPLRDRFPDNWELLYREGVALAKAQPEEAATRFEAILSLNLRDDEPALGTPSNIASSAASTQMPLVDRMNTITVINQTTAFAKSTTTRSVQTATGITRVSAQNRLRFWVPRDYGEVRIAAWGWLTSFATRDRQPQKMAERVKQLELSSTRQSLVDQYAIHRFLGNESSAEKVARKLAQHSEAGLEEKSLYLQALAQRHQPRPRTMTNGQTVLDQPTPAPLYAEELDEATAIYRDLASKATTVPLSPTFLNTVIKELALAERTAEASQLLNEAIDKASTDAQLNAVLIVVYSMQVPTANRPAERALPALATGTLIRLLDRMIEFQAEATANRAGIATTALASGNRIQSRAVPNYVSFVVVQHLRSRVEWPPDQILEVWVRYLKLGTFSLAERLKQPEGRSNTAVQMGVVQQSGTAPTALWLGTVLDVNAPEILAKVWNSFHQKDKSPNSCLAQFEARSQSPDISNEERILWLSALAHLCWINEDRKSYLNLLTEAAALAPQVVELQLNLARIYEQAGQSKRALEIVEAILPTTNDWQVEREQMALRLALAIDNKDRAKAAAERLFGLKLNPIETLPLAEQMVKLDMVDRAEALLQLSRLNSTAPGNRGAVDIRAQRVLLDIQLSRGRHDEATQTALAMLKLLETTDAKNLTGQSQQVVTASNGQQYIVSVVNGRQVVTQINGRVSPQSAISVPEYRQHVFHALHKTGKLAEMIEEAETKLKSSPRNEALIATLMTYHKVVDNSERVGQLTLQQLAIDQDKPDKRFAAIINLLNLGRVDEAATQARLLMESHPDFFAPRCRDMIFRFQSKNALRKLAKEFEQLDWSLYDKYPDVLPMVIEQLAAEILTEDIATKLFVTAWETRPERRLELLTRSPDEQWWKRPELADGLRRLPIPTKEADLVNQWAVFGRSVSKPASRQISRSKVPDGSPLATVLNRLLTVEAERDKLKAFASDVEQGRQQFPSWMAGQVLLALIDLRRERVAAGRDVLKELLPTLSKLTQSSPLIPWEIAEELARHEESLDTAVSYYEVALRDRGTEAWTSSTSPVRGIVQSLAERGRKSDARRILLSLLPVNVQRGGDPAVLPSSVDLHVAQWVGRELRGIGHPIEAIHIYQAALERAEKMTIGGYDPRVDLQSSLLIAFKELQPASLVEFFAARSDIASQLDPQLFVTEPKTPSIKLRSRWTPFLETIASDAEAAVTLKDIFAKACERHPDDLATLIFATQFALATKDVPETKLLVAKLVRHVEQHPQEELSTVKQIAMKQQYAALPRIALWLIARQCLTVPELEADAIKLADAALVAADVHWNGDFSLAIKQERDLLKSPTNAIPK